MRGFNDFFFAVGIVLFGAGIAFFAGTGPIKNLLAAALIWALAEFLVRRMRLVLPGILLVSLFAFFVFRLAQLNWAAARRILPGCRCGLRLDSQRDPIRCLIVSNRSRLR